MDKNRMEPERSGDANRRLPAERAKPGNQPRTRRRNLLAQGISPGQVHRAARSRKGYLNKAVDDVRKQEHRQLMKNGDDSLKGTKYLWVRNFPDLRCEPGFRELYSANLKTSRAWRLKETFEGLWNYRYKVPAILFFQEWHLKVKRSRLEPMRKVARMIEERLPSVLNYLEHRITNAGSEGMNSLLARIIAQARGLRSIATLRARALFFLGKLDLAIA